MARYGWEHDRPGWRGHAGYHRGYGGAGWMGAAYPGMGAMPGLGYPWTGPVAGYGSVADERGYGRDYDRSYKSDWQTDRGDPYGDREQKTPIRTTRGPFHARDRGYDRDHYRQRVEYGYRGDGGYHEGGFRGEDRYRRDFGYRGDDGSGGRRGYDRRWW